LSLAGAGSFSAATYSQPPAAGVKLPNMSLEVAPSRTAEERDLDTTQLRALAHPLRLRMLSLLTSVALTAAEVARELSLNHANASYHLRQLHAAGLIELVGQEQIRGGQAKRYRYLVGAEPKPTGPAPGSPPGEAHALLYAALAAELRRRSSLLRHHRGNHLTDAELWVDPTVWAEVRQRVTAASTDLHRAARAPRTPDTIRVNATMALFEMEPDR
jgi:DNA-binding transcriptional ArsR family regulator